MFEAPIEPRRATLFQWMSDLSGSTCVSRIAIECSNDGFVTDIRRAATVTARDVRSNWEIPLSQVGGGRWWRALALSEPHAGGDTWSVADFQLSMTSDHDWPDPGPIAGSRSTPAYGPECAFDSGMTLPWVALERHEEVEEISWIGWDYGESRHQHVVAFKIRQWDGGEKPNVVARVALEYSDDAFSSHSEMLQCFDLTEDTQQATIKLDPHDIFARSWRIRALRRTGGGCWGIQHLQFLETEEPTAPPTPAESGAAQAVSEVLEQAE
jgi:hypothetical protein